MLWVLLVVLGGSGYWYYQFQMGELRIAENIDTCEAVNRELSLLLSALRDNSLARCDKLVGYYKSRCIAFIENDPAKCGENDFDCPFIASKNESGCMDPVCRAFIVRDPSACAGLEGALKESCVNIALLNAEAFVKSRESCESEARTSI